MTSPGRIEGFERSLAFLIAVDRYENGIPELRTPVSDATELAKILDKQHGFTCEIICNECAKLDNLRHILSDLSIRVNRDDRVLFYFAGHGIALPSDTGPRGYLLPQDAARDSTDRYLSMVEFNDALAALPCRHMLVILDCCFAGAFRWSSTRDLSLAPENLHRERYAWYVQDAAWQAIASAAHDQKALDVADGEALGARGQTAGHSPFAAALIDGLTGAADRKRADGPGDGVITATELFLHLEDQLMPRPSSGRPRQTPILWPLTKHDKGQFVFLVPGTELNLPPAPPLDPDANPWRGLNPYESRHAGLFFGRRMASDRLLEQVLRDPLVVVTGPSGIGKSSLVQAGLLPRLPPHIRPIVVRPGPAPFVSLAAALASEATPGASPKAADLEVDRSNALARWVKDQHSAARQILLVIDQAEELVTMSRDEDIVRNYIALISDALKSDEKFRIVVTVRSDFEPQFAQTALKNLWLSSRYLVPQMTQDELRRVIEGPAAVKVMRFESTDLVDILVNEVVQMPGALPLLSFALSEMYANYIRRHADDRTLTAKDYDALEGGVAGSLRVRANRLFDELDGYHKLSTRRVLERLVSVESGELARRRVPRRELEVVEAAENERVGSILERFIDARLIIISDVEAEPHLELAHDALIFGWDRLLAWVRADLEHIIALRRLTLDAEEWRRSQNAGLLWDDTARIAVIKRLKVQPTPGINATENRFIAKSLQRSNFNTAVRWSALALFALLAFGASLLAYVSTVQRNRAVANEVQAFASLSGAALSQHHASDAATLALAAIPRDRADRRPLSRAAFEALSEVTKTGAIPINEMSLDDAIELDASQDIKCIFAWNRNGTLRFWNGVDYKNQLEVNHENIEGVTAVGSQNFVASWASTGEIVLWDCSNGTRQGATMRHTDSIANISPSNNGDYLHSWSTDGIIKTWLVPSGAMFETPIYHQGLRGIKLSADGSRILSRAEDGSIRVWSVSNRAQIGKTIYTDNKYSIVGSDFHKLDNFIISWSYDNTIRLWDLGTGQQYGPPMVHSVDNDDLISVLVTESRDKLISWSGNIIKIWKADDGSQVGGTIKHDEIVGSIAVTKQEDMLVSWSGDKTIRVWDLKTQAAVGSTMLHDAPLFRAAGGNSWGGRLNFDDDKILSWGRDGSLRLWDLQTGRQIGPSMFHPTKLSGGIFLGSDYRLLSWSVDGGVKIWNIGRNQAMKPRFKTSDGIHHVEMSRDKNFILAWSGDSQLGLRTATVFDTRSATPIGTPVKTSIDIAGMKFMNGDRTSFSWGEDGTIRMRDIATGLQQGEPMRHGAWVRGVLALEDGKKLVSWGDDFKLKLWNTSDQSKICAFNGHSGGIVGAMVPNGKNILISWSDDGTLKDWDLEDCRQSHAAMVHDQAVSGVLADDQSGHIFSWSADGTIKKWDIDQHAQSGPSLEHQSPVKGVLLAKKLNMLVSWSEDSTLQRWSAVDNSLIGAPLQHQSKIIGAKLSSDEKYAAVWSEDQVVSFWDLKTGEQHGKPINVGVKIPVYTGSQIMGVKFNEDDSRVFVWNADNRLYVFDNQTRQQIGPSMPHVGDVMTVSFMSGESVILTAPGDDTLRLIDIGWPKGNLISIMCSMYTPPTVSGFLATNHIDIVDPICTSDQKSQTINGNFRQTGLVESAVDQLKGFINKIERWSAHMTQR